LQELKKNKNIRKPQKGKMHKYNAISIAVPTVSVILILLAFLFIKPSTTGLVIYGPNETAKVNADVTLKTTVSEIIPPDAIITVKVDDKKSQMSIAEFIKKTRQQYNITYGELPEFSFYGKGFTGDYTYTLTLADFNLDRDIGKGEHVFVTQIKYRDYILYEKENKIMISE
jgi:hypothetical protein